MGRRGGQRAAHPVERAAHGDPVTDELCGQGPIALDAMIWGVEQQPLAELPGIAQAPGIGVSFDEAIEFAARPWPGVVRDPGHHFFEHRGHLGVQRARVADRLRPIPPEMLSHRHSHVPAARERGQLGIGDDLVDGRIGGRLRTFHPT